MTEETSVHDPSKRRRRRRRKRGGGGSGGGGGGSNSGGGDQRGRTQPKGRSSHAAPREPRTWDGEVIPMTGFELFCAYWLGIGENNTYRKPNIRDVGRRFDKSAKEIEDALKFCGMDMDTVKKSGFEMGFAQLDISVAPEGIDKKELAKGLFEEFLELNSEYRDWVEPEPVADSSDAFDGDDVDNDDVDASEEE